MKKFFILTMLICGMASLGWSSEEEKIEYYFKQHLGTVYIEVIRVQEMVSAKTPLSPDRMGELCYRLGSIQYPLMAMDDQAFYLKVKPEKKKIIEDALDVHRSLKSFCSMPEAEVEGYLPAVGKDRTKLREGLSTLQGKLDELFSG